jgi:hypothetical protein
MVEGWIVYLFFAIIVDGFERLIILLAVDVGGSFGKVVALLNDRLLAPCQEQHWDQ